MDKHDYMYRAFKSYRKDTDERGLISERKALKNLKSKIDHFSVLKYRCTIEDDWIRRIEEGLVYVEKAIAEERQFIRSTGETVPIEKAKKVSRDSIVHLAKHSNLISRVPEDPKETLVPDEIYIVEKLSDYAVYENRFLYMLLIQLQEFIVMRLDKIKKLRMTYICDFAIEKQTQSKTRVISFKEEFHEERYDNPYPIPDERSTYLLKRIEDLGIVVNSYLKTNLMVEVAKAPMIKPPVTKTNVLKMNNNFKNALALYDYICAYKGLGYTSEEIHKEFTPLQDLIADEFNEVIMLASHLTYKHGNEILSILEQEYQKEEERRKEQENIRMREQLARVKKKVIESGLGMEGYMQMLEERNRDLEKDSQELALKKQEIEALNQKIESIKQEILELKYQMEGLKHIIEGKDKEIQDVKDKFITEIEEIKKTHEDEIALIEEECDARIDEINELKEAEIERIKEEALAEINQNKLDLALEYDTKIQEHEDKIASLTEEKESLKEELSNKEAEKENALKEMEEELNQAIEAKDTQIEEYEAKLKEMEESYLSLDKEKSEEINSLRREKQLAIAEYNAIRVQTGKLEVSDDYTTKERFDELEREFEAFNQFFKAEWKRTKRAIRKKLLWTKEEKEALSKDPDFKAEPKEIYPEPEETEE